MDINNENSKIAKLLTKNSEIVHKNYKLVELFCKNGLYRFENCEFIKNDETSTEILKRLDIM